MREILFRGKRIDNGEWTYGDFLHKSNYGNENCISDTKTGIVKTVDIDTVCEFTGLYDKNGFPIFESDICKLADADGYFVVTFSEQDAKFEFFGGIYVEAIGFDETYPEYCEVIGNIYDNPELLEDTQNEN